MIAIGSGRPFHVAVITPERKVYEGEATFAVVPAWDGEIGILHDHAPLLALLGSGTLRLETSKNGTLRFRVSGGFVQVVENEVAVLSEEATEV
ncbi:MAG: F0F1 ATP synthase subunit epsilon [Gemmatimonadetes bacterium]|nr:F0F1 ATP synthase subunit epsilon [Gemmatimonadota bacterium]